MTAQDNDPRLHRIVVERDSFGEVEDVRFVCDGDDAAPCHHYPECDCEVWTEEHQQDHPAVQRDECWMAPWFGTLITSCEWLEVVAEEGYARPTTEDQLRDGAIDVWWDGDMVTWSYADPADAEPEQGVLL